MTTTASNTQVIPTLTLGWRLQMALGQIDMSVAHMAAELGVSRQTVTRWLHDVAVPRAAFIKQWALITNVPAAWLLDGLAPAPGLEPGTYRLAFGYVTDDSLAA